MTPELKARIEAILAEPRNATIDELMRVAEEAHGGLTILPHMAGTWWPLLREIIDSMNNTRTRNLFNDICLAWLTMKLEEER